MAHWRHASRPSRGLIPSISVWLGRSLVWGGLSSRQPALSRLVRRSPRAAWRGGCRL